VNDAPEYLIERLRTAFADDCRVNELGIIATIVDRRITLRGTVGSEERRVNVTLVAREILPGYEILNDCTVAAAGRPDEVESL
jgi:hypothetical protein